MGRKLEEVWKEIKNEYKRKVSTPEVRYWMRLKLRSWLRKKEKGAPIKNRYIDVLIASLILWKKGFFITYELVMNLCYKKKPGAFQSARNVLLQLTSYKIFDVVKERKRKIRFFQFSPDFISFIQSEFPK